MATSKKTNKPAALAAVKEEQAAAWARPSWVAMALMVLSLMLYANTLSHEYAQDDAIVITENMYTTKGVQGWPGIFTKDTFFGYFKVEGKDKLVSGGRYRPLSLALFALEYQVFGDSPKAMHFFNALWYGLTVVVCYFTFLLLWRMAENKPGPLPNRAHYLALAAALIFAVHPVHTEAVANIKGRDEILSLLGSMGALGLVLRAHVYKQPIWLPVAFVCFLLGLLAKENAITFLAVIPLAMHLFGRTKLSQTVLYTLPFIGAAVVFLLIRAAVIGWDFGPLSRELMNNPFLKYVNGSWVDFSLSEKLATIVYTLGKYLQLLLLPYPLTHDYYPRQVGIMSWTHWQVALSLLTYIGLLAYGTWALLKGRKEGFFIWFFIATLSIVSNLVFPIGTNMSERFLFMPSVAYALALPFALDYFLNRDKRAANWSKVWLVTGLIALVYAGITVSRNPVWKNNYTLFTADIERSPNSAKLRNAMAGELSNYWLKLPGRENRMEVIQEAIGHAKEAIRIHPTYLNAYLILGNCYNYTTEYDKSIEAFQHILKLDPNYELADVNLSATYRDAGRYYGEKKNDLARSVQYLQEAYRRNPTDYETLRLLGVASGIGGDNQSAIMYFTKALEQQPENAFAWYDLGTAYMISGQREEADKRLARAKEIDPLVEERRKQKTN